MELWFGVVSNVWSGLFVGSSLAEQCELAVRAGYRYVELRQGGLAECEEANPEGGPPLPLPDQLGRLRLRFPDLTFNLAVEAPFQTNSLDPANPYLTRCAAAAAALEAGSPLRLVDLSSVTEVPGESQTDALVNSITGFAATLGALGIPLVLENSKLPVIWLRNLINQSNAALSPGTHPIRLCWDPANQRLQRLKPEAPDQDASALFAGHTFEFHFKQLAFEGDTGRVLPDVREGDLNWRTILTAARDSGFVGPALHEIPPGTDIWDRLTASQSYVAKLWSEVSDGG